MHSMVMGILLELARGAPTYDSLDDVIITTLVTWILTLFIRLFHGSLVLAFD